MSYYLPYLEFVQEHGRDPRSDELTLDQRLELFRCALENLKGNGHGFLQGKIFDDVEENPEKVQRILRAMESEHPAEVILFRHQLMVKGHAETLREMREITFSSVATDRLEEDIKLIKIALGLDGSAER
jgi:hypothetical protein